MNTSLLLQPDNHNKRYEALFLEIDTGYIKLPMFQRDFVWDKAQSAKLVDSLLKGYPIGTFIFWKTKESLRSYRNLGNHMLPSTPSGDHAQYVLDGQQRITSLYAIRKGIRITRDGETVDYKDIYIDLDFDPESDDQIVVSQLADGKQYVSVHAVLTSPLGDFYRERSPEHANKIEQYKNKLVSYDFSSITIRDYPIEIACEVFTRINTGGKTLTVFEIMVAKTYDDSKGFDLAEKYEELLYGSSEDEPCLQAAKFETISAATVMQCVAAVTLKAVRGRDILQIPRATFIDNWVPTKNGLFAAVDFVRSELNIPVSQLLPFSASMIPLTYFFFLRKGKKVTIAQKRYLEQFFYWAGVNGRYSGATESSIAEDLSKMEVINNGKQPSYSQAELTIDAATIEELEFKTSHSFCKAVLCLLASRSPRSFDTNGQIILDNSNLKIGSSRNYHHFFPKKFLENNYPSANANLVANITLIDGESNKHQIGKKPPSTYVGAYEKSNARLLESLGTHLIGHPEKYGIAANDYALFIKKRSERIASAINKKLRVE